MNELMSCFLESARHEHTLLFVCTRESVLPCHGAHQLSLMFGPVRFLQSAVRLMTLRITRVTQDSLRAGKLSECEFGVLPTAGNITRKPT